MKKQGTIKKDWNVLRNTAYKYSGATQKKAGECSWHQTVSLRLLHSCPDLVQNAQIQEFPG